MRATSRARCFAARLALRVAPAKKASKDAGRVDLRSPTNPRGDVSAMKFGTRGRTRHLAGLCCALSLAGLGLAATPAEAAPRLRRQFNLHGDFVMIGNTLGQECRTGAQAAPAPVVGTVGACGTNTTDSAYDVFWRADEPAAGQALASTAITLANARSTAVLGTGARVGAQSPAGANVVHAQLYWAATLVAGPPRPTVTLERPGAFVATVTATGLADGGGRRKRVLSEYSERHVRGAPVRHRRVPRGGVRLAARRRPDHQRRLRGVDAGRRLRPPRRPRPQRHPVRRPRLRGARGVGAGEHLGGSWCPRWASTRSSASWLTRETTAGSATPSLSRRAAPRCPPCSGTP